MENETFVQTDPIGENNDTVHNFGNVVSIPDMSSIYTDNDTGAASGLPSTNTGESSEYFDFMVSSGDVLSSDLYNTLGIPYEMENTLEQYAYTTQLEQINETLDGIHITLITIMFFIIVTWCIQRISNAVRSFAGIGLE